MAKVIKYKFKHCEEVDDIIEKTSPYSEEMEEAAKREAYNGEYEIIDDGQPDPPRTDAERIAELEEALEMLLSGVTE